MKRFNLIINEFTIRDWCYKEFIEKNEQKWEIVKYIYEIFGVMGDKMMIFRILKVS